MKEITAEDFSGERNEWPIKSFEVGHGLEFEDGFNGCSIVEIQRYAHAYGKTAGKKFKCKSSTSDKGKRVCQVLRVK